MGRRHRPHPADSAGRTPQADRRAAPRRSPNRSGSNRARCSRSSKKAGVSADWCNQPDTPTTARHLSRYTPAECHSTNTSDSLRTPGARQRRISLSGPNLQDHSTLRVVDICDVGARGCGTRQLSRRLRTRHRPVELVTARSPDRCEVAGLWRAEAMNYVRHTCGGRDDLGGRLAEIADH
jgi:hypothetical protein